MSAPLASAFFFAPKNGRKEETGFKPSRQNKEKN